MARWLVQLSGDRIDLEEFPRWLPDGDIFAIEEDGTFFLVGAAFEGLSDVEAVRSEAARAIDRFTAVISLLWPNLKKPLTTHVVRETDEGKRTSTVFVAAGTITARSKAFAPAVSVGDGPPLPPQPTRAQELLRRANGHAHLETALSLWSDPTRSWSRLYRILEEIEQHIGKPVDVAGYCSANERERFSRTANTAEVSGADARHATGKFAPPSSPMILPEAVEFITRMLLAALK
jgi:hypothetical protein